MKIKVPNICKVCHKEFYYKWGTKQTCSTACLTALKQTDAYRTNLVTKQRSAFMKKYGVDNPAKCEAIKEKTKQTCLERYGAVSPTLNAAVRQKQYDTCVERYGAQNPLSSASIQRKIKQTLMDRFGVEHTWESEEIKKRSAQTKLDRYGNKNYTNPEKARQNSLLKYGVESPTQLESVKEKTRQTNLKKYGKAYVQQTDWFKAKAKKTNLKKYGVDNPAKSVEIKKRTITNNLKKYGTTYPIGNKEINQRSQQTRLKNHYQNVILKKFSSLVEPLFLESEYIGNVAYGKKYPFRCIKCNNHFEDTLCSAHVPRCQICYPIKTGVSIMEKELLQFIKELLPNEVVLENDRSALVGLELDINIPSKKLAIEFNGNYWHSEIAGKKYKNYHINKTKKCEELGIHLIQIFEDEWLTNNQIIKDRLAYLLAPATIKKIYARKCVLREIDSECSGEFLDRFHLQGRDKSSIRIGAFYANKLVAVATFGSNRIALGNKHFDGEYELYRFCSEGCVVGVLSKFLKFFKDKYRPAKITTYADQRFSTTSKCSYARCGFSFIGETGPNYWYMKNNNYVREHRFKYRKSELPKLLTIFDPNLTEWENMQQNGYDRIWDCGNLKYEMLTTST
jgi:hypothetical protein